MPELPETVAAFGGTGYIVAPAGFGKTHLIASSLCYANRRQLVLTHTYAGVNALRRKLRQLGVAAAAFHVDTIASWTLRLSLSYPQASGWTTNRPSARQWTDLYQSCVRLLDSAFIRRIVAASYGGMYVDEYQDCSRAQHSLMLKLARDLPCRILGDPLQGIFDFDDEAVDWEADVAAAFECIGQLDTPHRWNQAGSPALGEWLRDVRAALEARQPIDLRHAQNRIRLLMVNADPAELVITQGNACRTFQCHRGATVVAIHAGEGAYKAKCHALAKKLGGAYSSLEEIEGKDLFSFVSKVQGASTDKARLKHAIDLAERAMTNVKANLPAASKRGERADIRPGTRNPPIARAANAYLERPSSGNLAAMLIAVRDTTGVHVARADLLSRAVGVLKKHSSVPQLTLGEAAEQYQTSFRHWGRPPGRKRVIGTTLLVKGLEFDHAIVLDAASLSRKQLYVALTRGAKSLAVISTSAVLDPPE